MPSKYGFETESDRIAQQRIKEQEAAAAKLKAQNEVKDYLDRLNAEREAYEKLHGNPTNKFEQVAPEIRTLLGEVLQDYNDNRSKEVRDASRGRSGPKIIVTVDTEKSTIDKLAVTVYATGISMVGEGVKIEEATVNELRKRGINANPRPPSVDTNEPSWEHEGHG